MKYTKKEIKEVTKNATLIEVYQYTDHRHHIHTDSVKYIGNGQFDESELDSLTYDEDGYADVDIRLMDEVEYNTTIFANCTDTWESAGYAKDDIVAVIVQR